MSKIIVWENGDGTIAITHPLEPMLDGETETDYLDRIAAKLQTEIPDQFAALEYETVESTNMPPSRRFRAAWRLGENAVATDVPLAKALLKDAVRSERDTRLNDSDKEWLRLQAVGTQQAQDDYAAFRQALRDLPEDADTAIDALTTEAALLAYAPTWPTEP